jgi:hypothetical protein
MEELIVCITSPPPFIEEIFLKWVKGVASDQQSNRTDSTSTFQFRHPMNLSFSDNLPYVEQYRVFEVLEHFICQPLLLNSQMMIQIPSNVQKFIVQKYWGLNDSVVREIVYKRLNKSRKDLDDVSDCTGLNLKSVTRQFDNLKRIYTFIEDNQWQCNILSSIESNFLLDPLLARKYSCVLFLQYSKFNLTSKKRMQRVCFDGLEKCAALTLVFLASDSDSFFKAVVSEYISTSDDNESLTNLINSPIDYYNILLIDDCCWPIVWKIFSDIDTVELDKQMLINLRDLRTILTGEVLDTACSIVLKAIIAKGETISSRRMLDLPRIRTVLKSLMQIGGHLSQTREFRDMLEDFLAKIVEPLEEAYLTPSEIRVFLECCSNVVKAFPDSGRSLVVPSSRTEPSSKGDPFNGSLNRKLSKTEQLRLDWLRFVTFSRLCITQLIRE